MASSSRPPAPLDERRRQLLALLLKEEGVEPLRTPILPLPRAGGGGSFPLSFAQERLWLLDQIEPGNIAYNVPVALRLQGALRPEILARSLGEIVRRHEVLRTTFAAGAEGPVQVVAPPAPLPLPRIDLAALPGSRGEAEAERLALAEADRPFDLLRGPVLRGRLLCLGMAEHAEHVLLLTVHHIASDGWSTGIFVRELMAIYEAFAAGRPSPLPLPAVQYADFAAWERRVFRGEVLERALGYWRRQLGGDPPVLALPLDRPRPAVQGRAGGSVRSEIPAATAEALRALGRTAGATLFMVITAAFQGLLARLAGQDEVSVGTPVANRHRMEVEGLLGYFGNTLVLRTDLSGDPTFHALLGRVREVAIGAFGHQELPFSQVVLELKPERSLAHTPLFQVMCAVEAAGTELAISGLALTPFEARSDAAMFDLHLTAVERGRGDESLPAELSYRTDLFDGTTARRMLGQLATLLAGIVAAPERRLSALPILSPPERQALLVEWNDSAAPLPEESLAERLAAQAGRTPDTVAVAWEDGALTYGELDRRAGRLARELGAGPGARVAIRGERSAEMAIELLAVLQAGATAVPLDPLYPAERRRFMLEDSKARVGPPAPADDLAYILYTSGSTGRPKGVGMPRAALVNLLAWQERAALPGPARTLQFASLSFDVSFQEILSTWWTGGTLVLTTEEIRRDPAALLAEIETQAVERLFLPFVALRQLAEAAVAGGSSSAGPALRDVVTAGEALQVTGAVAAWLGARPGRRLHNHYGPTESHVVTAWTLAGDPRGWPALPPIGRPIANVMIHLLDRHLEPVPVGVVGEICIGGVALARGYIDRPEATAERFLPAPQGRRLYRTGDLARRRTDGALEYLGRRDAQVKVRGVRVEPGEVEAALLLHPGVRQAVVAAVPEPGAGPGGPLRLVVWYLPAEERAPTVAELRDHLRRLLPEAFVPSQLAAVASLPLTPSGKVDRRALTLAAPEAEEPAAGFVAPRSEIEALLAGIWAGLLGRERVGVRDRFFDLGGHSLLATQVMSRLRSGLGVELPLRTLFESPTVEELARSIERALGERSGPAAPPLVRSARRRDGDEAPLSFSQQRLWFLHQLNPESPAYNMVQALRLTGRLDEGRLAAALAALVRRQEALRTRFVVRGPRAVQVVSPVPAIPATWLPVIDLQALPAPRREEEGRALAHAEGLLPFDLEHGPVLRVRLLRLATGERLFLLSMHHIVSDAWSMEIFVRELRALYLGEVLPAPPLQYADYARWQREWLTGEVLAAELAYWRERLAGAPPVLALPLDRARPPLHTFAGARRFRRQPPALGEALPRLGRRLDATPFMLLLAFWKILLLRHTGETDLVVGSPVANRNRQETEGLIGFFVNTLALRTDLSGDPPFAEVARRVRETALGAYTHQDLPFEKLVEELQPARSLRHTPIFQVMLVAEPAPAAVSATAAAANGENGLRIDAVTVDNGTAKLDLTLIVQEGADGFELGLGYSTDLFFPTTIERLLGHAETLLAAALADPERPSSDLPLLAAAERQQLLAEWNDTSRSDGLHLRLHELFTAQAEARPDAPAVVWESEALTYGELARRSRRLAERLRARGVGPETRVAIYLPRSPAVVVAILAVLQAGGAYLPLDPSHPPERVAFQLADAGAALLLTREAFRAALPADVGVPTLFPETNVEPEVGRGRARTERNCLSPKGEFEHRPQPDPARPPACRDPLAYVLYTSGSTGVPSGVLMTHRGAVNVVVESRRRLGVMPESRMLQLAPLGFDVSVGEIFVALASGAALCMVGDDERGTPGALAARISRFGVDRAFVTPAFFAALSTMPADFAPGLVASVGGEAFPRQLAARWVPGRRLFNNYGPTEAAVYATSRLVDPADPGEPAIGRPIADVRAYLLDFRLQPVAIGVAGEICLGGAGLARGYARRPEKTAERFVPHPWPSAPGERLYRTGDLARLLPTGEIEFLGRIDHQIKVRGFRIEPGEIEAVLLRHPAVRQAVVVVRGESAAERHLVAYVGGSEIPESAELRRFLAGSLPEPMVPAVVVMLPALPVTASGKVDRRALPDPERAGAGALVPPETPMERFLAGLWEEVLGRAGIGVDDDFFALGGTSIQAAVLTHLLEERFGEYVYVVALFDAPTLGGLARYLAEHYPAAAARVLGEAAGKDPEDSAARVDEAELERFRTRIEFLPPRDPARLLPPRNRRVLFLLSPPRSGSTLLRVMLAGNPALFAPPELELLGFNTLRERSAAFSGRYAFWAEGLVRAVMEIAGCGPEAAAEILAGSEARDLTVREMYAELQRRIGDRLLVDKTPSYSLDPKTLARAEEDFEAPLYLHLIRHPHSMVRSFTQAKLDQVFFHVPRTYPRRTLAELIWTASQRIILEFLAGIPAGRQIAVRFEELVRDPEPELRRISTFLEIPFHSAMLDPYAKSGRMTDGIHALSKMLGDVKFHQHRKVDPEVAESWKRDLENDFLGEPTWKTAEALGYRRPERPTATPARRLSPLVPLAQGGPGSPLFLVHPVGGNVLCYRDLARHLKADRPVYGLQALGLGPGEPQCRVEEMAATYLESVLAAQPEGPYFLGGWSIGGTIAWEMAQQLRKQGREVALLALLDSVVPAKLGDAELSEEEILAGLAAETGRPLPTTAAELGESSARRLLRVFTANLEAARSYAPEPYSGKILLARAARRPKEDGTLGWGALAPEIEVTALDADHYDLLQEPAVGEVAQLFRRLAEEFH